ncbi:MAG: hypothetical protein AAGD25_36375 [Cyanobacteria bacterium P01_F01_bin.150]
MHQRVLLHALPSALTISTMVAAEIYNHQDGETVECIYGTVTTGHAWNFLKLDNQKVCVDIKDYYINDPIKIVGILMHMIKHYGLWSSR